MRLKGGRLGWKGWQPHIGMVGYVVHIWTPNHPDAAFRSVINRDLCLVEIGEYYVPITSLSLKPYKQMIDKNQKDHERLLRTSLQRDMLELRQLQQQVVHQTEKVLTPILGSLESPTCHLAVDLSDHHLDADLEQYSDLIANLVTIGKSDCTPKIQAVSSSSSEDENELLRLEKQRRENFLNIWKHISDKPLDIDIDTNDMICEQQQEVNRKQSPEEEEEAENTNEFPLTEVDNLENSIKNENDENENKLIADSTQSNVALLCDSAESDADEDESQTRTLHDTETTEKLFETINIVATCNDNTETTINTMEATTPTLTQSCSDDLNTCSEV